MNIVRSRRLALLAIACGAAVTTGCAGLQALQMGDLYYAYGPETVVEAVAMISVPPEDRCLVAMELAMARLELGDYARVGDALAACDAPPGDLEPERVFYDGEPHEKVWREVVRTSAGLALQDGRRAAGGADRIMEAITASVCTSCDFRYARWVAALGYDAGWRRRDALRTLADMVDGGPGSEWLASEMEAIWRRSGVGPGFAPPPAGGDTDRQLVLALMLGIGPQKTRINLYENGEFERSAPGYERIPAGSRSAVVRVDAEEWARATVVTDLVELADTALEARREVRGLETEFGRQWSLSTGGMDLRHWGSLPAVGAGLTVEVPWGAERVTLRYLDQFGFELGRETFDVPAAWRSGPLYVVRRVP